MQPLQFLHWNETTNHLPVLDLETSIRKKKKKKKKGEEEAEEEEEEEEEEGILSLYKCA